MGPSRSSAAPTNASTAPSRSGHRRRPPAAGRRRIAIPPHVLPDIESHLRDFVGSRPDSPMFTGPKGGTLYRKTFARSWRRARKAVGVEHLHFHDLRHTGNTLAATTGASTKELMVRMGHANPRAALIYQHATEDRHRSIAEALSELAKAAEIRPLRSLPDSSDEVEDDGEIGLH